MKIEGFRESLQKVTDENMGEYPSTFTRPMVVTRVASQVLSEAISCSTELSEVLCEEIDRRIDLIVNSEVSNKADRLIRLEVERGLDNMANILESLWMNENA